jgi:hypothetical protein
LSHRERVSTPATRGHQTFYERYGFERTGDIVFDNEVLLQLKLR